MPGKVYHVCAFEECGLKFECVGRTPSMLFCACAEQALTGSGLIFYCSYACERAENAPTDSDDE